jgi:phenylacetate-CoA ligase
MGSWGALIAAERLGATAFPFGAGASGMTARAAHWLNIVKPAVLYGTPSYALHLAEVAQAEGLNPRELGLKRMFFSGEPGASIPSIRERIEEAFGARVYDSGTMAEMTPWISAAGTEETAGMVLYQDMVYHEVCDPQTYRRVSYGSRGTPVYTHLERTSQPMIRLASGDLTLWVDGPTPCGRTYPFLPQGIFGRIDDMFTIRGENIYPSEIDAVLNMLPNYGGEHRIIVTRTHVMDELLIQLEGNADVYQQPDVQQALHAAAERELLRVLGVRTRVEIVPANTFPRTDAKARRVIDNRDLFRSLTMKLER